MKKIILLLFLCLGMPLAASFAQTSGQDDIQSWNDIQLTIPMTKQFDFYSLITTRTGKNITRFTEGRYSIGFVYKPDKKWAFQPFYSYITARNAAGRFRIEHRLQLRIGYKFPFKGFGLSHRSQFEYRIRRPRDSWRYRPSLTFEKDLPKKFIPGARFYITDEAFYDSILKKFSRNRFSIGINKTISKKLSVDIYFMRQNDGNSRPGDLSAIGTTWKIKL